MADATTSLLTIWMPHFTEKLHLGWIVRVVTGELKLGLEEASLFICKRSMLALAAHVYQSINHLLRKEYQRDLRRQRSTRKGHDHSQVRPMRQCRHSLECLPKSVKIST